MKPVPRPTQQIILYLVFGVLTTLVNILSYAALTKLLTLDYKAATTLAWVVAVLFAFFTNKFFVFNSLAHRLRLVLREFGAFVFFRAASYLLDITTMVLFIEILRFRNDLAVKVLANIFVIIANYIASKYIVFKQRR